MSGEFESLNHTKQDSNYITRPELRSAGRAVRPRDSATLILVRRDNAKPQILMGKRSADHAFMPNKYVFPGGKVDLSDARIKPHHDLHPEVLARLMIGCSRSRARALAMAAVRETYEETGFIIGESQSLVIKTRSRAWGEFLKHGINPRLDTLHFIARAITPPYRSRRFDARFFMTDVDSLSLASHRPTMASGELLQIHWVTLSEARKLELPRITRLVLDEVEKRILVDHKHYCAGPFVRFQGSNPILERQ